jgi:phasin family protein
MVEPMVGAGNGLFKAIGRQLLTLFTSRRSPEGLSMIDQDTEKSGKMAFDTALNALGVWTKGAHAIAVEVIDYTKRFAESSAAAWEKLAAAKSLDTALAIQSDFARSAYEGLVAEATKLGEIYVELAREAYAPLQTAFTAASTRT